MFTSAVCS